MKPEEREAKYAELTAHLAERPEAVEVDDPALFSPGAILFIDGRYVGVSSNITASWELAERLIQSLFDFMPEKHRPEFWRERIERGAALLVVYLDSADCYPVAAGLINCEPVADGSPLDGTPIVTATVMTFSSVDLEDLSKIVECVAVMTGADAAVMLTPRQIDIAVVPGYLATNGDFWRMQGVRVRPMQ